MVWVSFNSRTHRWDSRKFSSLVWLGAKEKTSLESFTFSFGTWQIILSRLRPSFEALPSWFGNPDSATKNAWGSQWWAIFIRNHSSQDLGCEVLVANNAQRCFSILPSFWQLSLNGEFNTKQHNKSSNFIISRSFC